MIEGISHITLLVTDVEKSGALFKALFDAKETYSSNQKQFSISREKFFIVGGIWFALMQGNALERSYRHIAFKIKDEDLAHYRAKIESLNLEILPGRTRHPEEGQSIYFYDYDNHLFELHTGNLETRLAFYHKN